MFPNKNLQSHAPTVIAAIVIALLAPATHAALSFDPAVNYAVGDLPEGVATGDFNGDTFADLAITTDNPDKVEILLNDGSGSFVAGPVIALPASSSPGELVAGDLDGDLDVDLAVALRDFSSVIVLLNNAGIFTTAGQFPTGLEPRGMSIADMDADEDLDIAVANRDSNTVTILANNGLASFASMSVAVGAEPRDVAFGDFGGDPALDLAVTNHDDRTISILINNAGVFTPTTTLSVGADVRPDGITAADLDSDGDTDLAVAVSSDTPPINAAAVFLSLGATFGGPFSYAVSGTNPSRIIAADFDCDGLVDLATVNTDSNSVSALPNLGGGVFGAAVSVGVGVSPGTLAASDLDGNGSPDIATANRDSNDASVIANGVSCVVPGDVDGDGDVDLTDLAELLGAYGTCEGDPGYNPNADFVIDSPVSCIDLSDLAVLLGNYGS